MLRRPAASASTPCSPLDAAWLRAYPPQVLVLQGSLIRLRDFVATDGEGLLALADDEAMFTYMKFRIDREWVERGLSRAVREQGFTPRPTYNLVVEDADGFGGLAGIGGMRDTGQGELDQYLRLGTHQAEFGWYLSSDRWGRVTPLKPAACYSASGSSSWGASACTRRPIQRTCRLFVCCRNVA